MARDRNTQPRAISTDTSLAPTYRAGLWLELQKFGSSDKDSQLSLWPQEEGQAAITVSGLDLSVTEDKALSALQILLDQTGYRGNLPGEEIDSERYHWRGTLPRLEVSFSDYYEAYGLTRSGDGSYKGHQADLALEALHSLASEPRAIFYERPKHKGGKRLSDLIRIKSPVIRITEITTWQDLEPEEAEEIRTGQDVLDKQRAAGLLIEFAPLVVDQIQDFYLLKPTTLHREIQDHLGQRRYSRSVSLFIEWLMTKNTATVKIRKNLLAERLRLANLIEQRHWLRLDQRLQEAIQTASQLGWLLSYQEDPPGMYTFRLNPDRCSRVQSQGVEEEDE